MNYIPTKKIEVYAEEEERAVLNKASLIIDKILMEVERQSIDSSNYTIGNDPSTPAVDLDTVSFILKAIANDCLIFEEL